MNNFKITRNFILIAVLIAAAFGFGLKQGAKGYVFSGRDFKIINQNNAPATVDYNLLWQALEVLNTKFIDKPVDQKKILYGAIAGAVSAAGDPYTSFFDPQQYKDFKTELGGTFDGIGAEVGIKDGNIVIIAPLDESPAIKAGIQAGDVLLKINDESVDGLTLEQAVSRIRGPKGTTVVLTVFRQKTSKQLEFKIVRQTIDVKSVKYEIKNVNGKNISYINIQRFGDDTSARFKEAVSQARSNNVSGIVLDLRNDPGGYLDTSVEIASYWVEPGKTVVSEERSDGTTFNYSARGNNSLSAIPTVVLINAGSASASEILAGALRDYGFAQLIGVKSFGKGSVQELVDLPENTAIKVTIAKWLTPKGTNINKNGLEPDIKVERTPEQFDAGLDPQLDKALELLK